MCRRRCIPDADPVIDVVAELVDVDRAVLVGRGRTQPLAGWRQFAMWAVRTYTCLSYPQIGEVFDGRDHSTVHHAVDVVSWRIDRQQPEEVQLMLGVWSKAVPELEWA